MNPEPMTKEIGKEMHMAFVGFDLARIRKEMEGIGGSWNGEDSWYLHEGVKYHEDDAGQAMEIVEKIDELQDLLNNFRA